VRFISSFFFFFPLPPNKTNNAKRTCTYYLLFISNHRLAAHNVLTQPRVKWPISYVRSYNPLSRHVIT
jgi:hypothetical protein